MSEPTYLVTSDETNSVIAEGSDLVATVASALDLGYNTGRIWNQYNGASMDLAEWVETHGARLRARELEDE